MKLSTIILAWLVLMAAIVLFVKRFFDEFKDDENERMIGI